MYWEERKKQDDDEKDEHKEDKKKTRRKAKGVVTLDGAGPYPKETQDKDLEECIGSGLYLCVKGFIVQSKITHKNILVSLWPHSLCEATWSIVQ